MKTETKVSVIAYDVELIDLRTGEHQIDRIVLEQPWIKVLNRVDISDRDFIAMSYARQGYFLHKMHTRRKVALIVDLEQLYNANADTTAAPQVFTNTEVLQHV